MTLVVKKFGGSSLADLSCMQQVLHVITTAREQGQQLVIVVSATQGHTDRLVQAARAISVLPDPREYDALLASAEQSSAALLSLLLIAQNIPAISLTGTQAGIRTNHQFNKAYIQSVDGTRIETHLAQGQVVVVTGFQGVNQQGDITTLGRGGSDMTAVVLAGVLKAKECHIYTDVDGVYSADPRIVPNAYRLDVISLAEMQQMAHLGAKVMQRQALDYCYQHEIPLRVLSTFKEGMGTLIVRSQADAGHLSGIACQTQQAQITLCNVIDPLAVETKLQTVMLSARIDIDLVVNSLACQQQCFDVHFTVHTDDFPRALLLAHEVAQEFELSDVCNNQNIAKVSLVGCDMKAHPSIAAQILALSDEANIEVRLILSNTTRITLVISEKDTQPLVELLHTRFIEKTTIKLVNSIA